MYRVYSTGIMLASIMLNAFKDLLYAQNYANTENRPGPNF